MLELYEVTFEIRHLETALELNKDFTGCFLDDGNGCFYFTAAGSEKSPVRQKEIYDGAVASENSVAYDTKSKGYKEDYTTCLSSHKIFTLTAARYTKRNVRISDPLDP